MITSKDLYSVLTAVVPLYTTMLLAYASVRWWRLFTQEQCAGINRFVAVFAVPLLSFEFISRIDPFRLHLPFLAADTASKLLILVGALAWVGFARGGTLDWAITAFSLASLPNTLVMGIPLLKAMYGDDQEGLMVQVVVLQCVVWYTLLLFLFEYRAAARGLTVQGGAVNVAGEGANPATPPQAEEDGVVVGVAMARRSPDPDQQRGPVLISKVVPESGQPPVQAEEGDDVRELRIFVWSCSFCCIPQGKPCMETPASRFEMLYMNMRTSRKPLELTGLAPFFLLTGRREQALQTCSKEEVEEKGKEAPQGGSGAPDAEKSPGSSGSTTMPSSQMVKVILRMVWWKLVRNPNSYASLLGLSWALASCRWNIKKPQIMDNSITILSNAGLGMAMFSLGLFMAMQPRIVACGYKLAAYGMVLRFLTGPVMMAIASLGVGLRGKTLQLSIVQAALPQGIVPFVFAREYNLHPDVLSTAVIFGMIVSLPITVLYYILLSFYGGPQLRLDLRRGLKHGTDDVSRKGRKAFGRSLSHLTFNFCAYLGVHS
ncbi:hypothetical protein Taro_012229 [Colocasia esculenta]|uniref:Auxin efflux carrier component n=1 Tax=Colocasia esculenta TaxID=4460 RepID=A0A843U8I1_COLES|nr:hypothetical protein [Colocasia esculenta]